MVPLLNPSSFQLSSSSLGYKHNQQPASQSRESQIHSGVFLCINSESAWSPACLPAWMVHKIPFSSVSYHSREQNDYKTLCLCSVYLLSCYSSYRTQQLVVFRRKYTRRDCSWPLSRLVGNRFAAGQAIILCITPLDLHSFRGLVYLLSPWIGSDGDPVFQTLNTLSSALSWLISSHPNLR